MTPIRLWLVWNGITPRLAFEIPPAGTIARAIREHDFLALDIKPDEMLLDALARVFPRAKAEPVRERRE